MKKLHNLDDRLFATQALMERIELEACGGPFRVVIPLRDGRMQLAGTGEVPGLNQKIFSFDLVQKLNHELGYDGAWLFMWIKPVANNGLLFMDGIPYQEARILWIDNDGDVQFTVEVNEQFSDMVSAGWDHWVNQCEDAHGYWRHQLKALDLGKGQSVKHAQGQSLH